MQQKADYDDLFTRLPTAKSNFLKGLSWDGNRIEQSLFDFLGKNKSLTFLSLSNCFSSTNEKEVSMLHKYLSQYHTVKKLIIKGEKKKFLGNLVETVISGVLRSPQIEFLDLTRNKGGNLGMSQMRRLLTSQTNLQCFIFERTKPTNFDTLSGFLRDSTQNKNIKISFPIKDMNSMLKKGIITDEQFNQVRSIFAIKSKPGLFYIEHYNTDFPRYFTPGEIEELRTEVVNFDVPVQNQNQTQNLMQNQSNNQQQKAETPRVSNNNNKNTSYNMNYGTLNMKSLKSRKQNEFFGNDFLNPSQQRKSPTKESINKNNQADDKDQYLMKQNRKIAKMTPKENDTFDSESASYNQESSSNDFFIPNNYNNDYEAATVKNRPIRNNFGAGPSAKQTSKGTKRRPHNRAESLAPVKKRRNRDRQTTPRNNNNNNNEDEIDDDENKVYNRRQTSSVRRPRRTRSSASQRPKTARRPRQTNQDLFENDDEMDNENENQLRNDERTPKSTRGSRTSRTTSSKKKPTRRQIYRNNINQDDDFDDDGFDNDNVRPLLRSKKTTSKSARNRRNQENFNDNNNVDEYDDNDNNNNNNSNDDDNDEEEELLYTYQQPSWDFPIKMKYIYETDTVKKIEDSYSNNAFANEILNENDERERIRKRKTVSRKKKQY